MSDPLDTVFANLAATLAAITDPATPRVYADSAEAVSLPDMPSIVLLLTPGAPQVWQRMAHDHYSCQLQLQATIVIGIRATGLPELNSRCRPWPRAVAKALANDPTLGGACLVLANPGAPPLATFRVGPIPWGDGSYYGVTATIPVLLSEPAPLT